MVKDDLVSTTSESMRSSKGAGDNAEHCIALGEVLRRLSRILDEPPVAMGPVPCPARGIPGFGHDTAAH